MCGPVSPGRATPTGLIAPCRAPSVLAGRPGREQPYLAGPMHGRGAILGLELGVNVADVRINRVDRDRQLAGDLRAGEIRRQVPQHPQLAGTQLLDLSWRRLITRSCPGSVKDVDDVVKQRRVRRLVPRHGLEQ